MVCNKDPEAFKKVMEKYEKERAEALKRLRERADEFSQEASKVLNLARIPRARFFIS